jgi:hypothetical protein
MFRDEIENLIGIREHDEIINYILKIRGGEWWYYLMIVSSILCS